MIGSLIALLLMQAGPNPAFGAIPGVPEELRNRPPRESEIPAPENPQLLPQSQRMEQCLALSTSEPEDALDYANRWRGEVRDELEMAQSAQCLGLGLTRLERYDEAREIFAVAAGEAPEELRGYRARLLGMAGNAALAEGKPLLAEPLFAQALGEATMAADSALVVGFQLDRASALVAAERLPEAAEALAAARAADPASARAWLLSATLSRRMERLDEAQRQIEQAAALDPRDPAIGLEAGVIAALAGRDADARRSFESVLLVAPDSDEANRATAYLEQLKP